MAWRWCYYLAVTGGYRASRCPGAAPDVRACRYCLLRLRVAYPVLRDKCYTRTEASSCTPPRDQTGRSKGADPLSDDHVPFGAPLMLRSTNGCGGEEEGKLNQLAHSVQARGGPPMRSPGLGYFPVSPRGRSQRFQRARYRYFVVCVEARVWLTN